MRVRLFVRNLADALVVGCVVVASLGFLAAARSHAQGKDTTANSAKNLRQIGIASIQYADERRRFQHVAKITELDGDHTTATSSRAHRALVYYGFITDPTFFVNEGNAKDKPVPLSKEAKADMRLFAWSDGKDATKGFSPLYEPAANGNASALTADFPWLSYAWTRRGLTGTARSTYILAGDKARITAGPLHKGCLGGNEKDCVQVVRVDGSVAKITTKDDAYELTSKATRGLPTLSGTGEKDGALGMLPDDE